MNAGISRPRIAIVVPGLNIGGGVPAVARFIHSAILRDGRFDVSLVSLTVSSRDPASILISSPRTWIRGIRTTTENMGDTIFHEVGAFIGEIEIMRYQPRAELSSLIESCDIIQVVSGTPAWANSVIGLSKPVALQVASLISVERRMLLKQSHLLIGLWRRIMTWFADRLDRYALTKVDYVFVENRWMETYVQSISRNGRPRVCFAPPGIDTNHFRPAAPGDIAPFKQPYILCVGRLSDPRKNIGLLIELFARVSAKENPLLVLAGKDLQGPLVMRWAHNFGILEKIRIIDNPSSLELARLYRHCCCFALPSDEEGFGIVVIEAMSCCAPVVATRCGGPQEIITHGEDGFLVDRGDVASMTKHLVLLANDAALRAKIGLRARTVVEEKYSEDVAGRVFLKAYDALLKK